MEIRDPVHGSIPISPYEVPILEAPFFQRLRGIKQLGLSEFAFPGATHTRYLHSIGVMCVATTAFDKIFAALPAGNEKIRIRQNLRMAALLHDIGHAPLSHSTESVMPMLKKLNLPAAYFQGDRQANHEDYTLKAILDSSFTPSFRQNEDATGSSPKHIAQLISGNCLDPDSFTVEGINYFPILHQLISGELDCDRMDYLLRDSYFCGVSYGKFDLDWLIDNLVPSIANDKAFLAISERALATFDDFLLSRFHMFLMIYFHYRAVCLEKMLEHYFQESGEYHIPDSIEEYRKHDDHFLLKVLRKSENRWAKKVISNQIPNKVFETFGQRNKNKLTQLIKFLEHEKIEYLHCSSLGRLSKYYAQDEQIGPRFPLKVAPQEFSQTSPIQAPLDIHEATDLFSKYSISHEVNRIHAELTPLTPSQMAEITAIIS